jgi:hypothetical protein
MNNKNWERLRAIQILMVAAFIMLVVAVCSQGGLSLLDGILFLLFEVVMIGVCFVVKYSR